MAYPIDFLDDVRARVTLESVIGRKLRLTRRGREFVGLCPFHSEKSPSFTVVEEKGFYHCFGCGAHGDVFRFLMESESLSFHEAVERLAAEAGVPLPKFSRQDLEQEKQRASLYDVMEKAAAWFIARLHSDEGKAAMSYLKGRGLSDETIRRFSLGLAPNRRTALKEFMAARNVPEQDLIATGLVIEPEDKGATFDRFRNRVMFPIADARGRTIAFGGRALDDAPAKYMNSPETVLFHKGRVLYNLGNAQRLAREKKEIVAVEGYMDAIALAEAGFENVVAPLGTALTDEQIGLLWRLAPEPVLCFDGDTAGTRAALRALERALPNLRPGFSLKFVWLPPKDDPDTLIRREGADAFRKLVAGATPLSALLWTTLTRKAATETPEQRAGLEKKVFETLARIQHDAVKSQYRSEFGKKLQEMFRAQRPAAGPRVKPGSLQPRFKASRPLEKSRNLLKTRLGRAPGDAPVAAFLEELILYTVLNHPKLASDHFEDFSHVAPSNPDLAALHRAILEISGEGKDVSPDALKERLGKQGFEQACLRLAGSGLLRNVRFARADAPFELADKWWLKTLERLNQFAALQSQYQVLEQDYLAEPDDAKWTKLLALKAEISRNVLNEDFLRDYDLDSAKGSFI